jgi:hypothetical protein
MISFGPVFPFDQTPPFGVDFKVKTSLLTGGGVKGHFGKEHMQIEGYWGLYFPIPLGHVAITPYGDCGFGIMFTPSSQGTEEPHFPFSGGFSLQGGLVFTTTAVPGLYLQAGYQRNWYREKPFEGQWLYPYSLYTGIGYAW